jgi:hypothetical protein
MESLDRPYGDDETDYVTVEPELTGQSEESRDLPLEPGDAGVAEGFEEAEAQLIDNIENAPPADRTLDGFDPDAPDQDVEEDVADDVAKVIEEHERGDTFAAPRDEEARQATAVYGEPDELDVTEVVRDPAEPDDDPGQGPGIAADR